MTAVDVPVGLAGLRAENDALRRANHALLRANEHLEHRATDAERAFEALARGEVDAVALVVVRVGLRVFREFGVDIKGLEALQTGERLVRFQPHV